MIDIDIDKITNSYWLNDVSINVNFLLKSLRMLFRLNTTIDYINRS